MRYEVFPSELPPCFNTKALAANSEYAISNTAKSKQPYSAPTFFSGYKSEYTRRTFAVPNPYHYCLAVDYIVNNEVIIKKYLFSDYSLTVPIEPKDDGIDGLAFSRRSASVKKTKEEIERLYQNHKYEIHLDIMSFFDSIYTHSISWAIHGKPDSKKKKKDKDMLGNAIDDRVRSLKCNETHGILIGNAVSRIISEVLLCKIDSMIQKRFPEISCCRYVDDYYIYVRELSHAQEIISFIRECLVEYQLSLNENKIEIQQSPFYYGSSWVNDIRPFINLGPEELLSELVLLYKKHKSIKVFRYGLKMLASYHISQEKWDVMQSKLLNLYVSCPALAEQILPILLAHEAYLKKTLLKEAIYTVINESIRFKHDQELVWAIWIAKVFDVYLAQSYYCDILQSGNDLAIIVVLDIINSKHIENKARIKICLDKLYSELCDSDSETGKNGGLLWGTHWLLAYEADLYNWFGNSHYSFKYASKDSYFKYLIKRNIHFYDSAYHYTLNKIGKTDKSFVTHSEVNQLFRKLIKKAKVNEAFSDDNSEVFSAILEVLEEGEIY